MTLSGLAFGGGAIANTLGSVFGSNAQSKAMRDAMEQYTRYIQGQRDTFLNQPEVGPIRQKLSEMSTGNYGYSPSALAAMRGGVTEDYGKALSDVAPAALQSSVVPGGGTGTVYSPGRYNRTTRLLGENLAVRKAEANRDITTKNEQQAQANMRFAVSALPSYMPGLPATPTISPSVFQGANSPDMGLYQGFGAIGNALMSAPQLGYYLGLWGNGRQLANPDRSMIASDWYGA